jgi:glycosyltransferase involved in cell wall biosynthesis
MKKTIIIEENAQFGRASTSATYCYDLVDLYNFIYICYDQGQPKITPPSSTKVIYVEKKNRVYKKIKLIQEIVNAAYKTSNSVLYLSYFRGVSLVRILVPFRKVIVDYRTGCINPNKWNRFLKNLLMTFEALFFRHKVVISIDLKQHLHLANNTKILPIGANILSTTNKQFDKLRLLYVGTLGSQRDVYKTIEGVVEFREKRPNADLRYDIIGKGNGMNHIKAEIQRFSAGDYIKVHGYVPDEEITPFYDNCNVGVCFARMEDYYLVQPFTKLYEYGLSGMALISVKVKDSVRRIDEKLGVLCDDNADSFADALVQLYDNRMNYDSKHIRDCLRPYTWQSLSVKFKDIIES